MGPDTAAATPSEPQDSARVTEDTSETSINTTDTTTAVEIGDAAVSDTAPIAVPAEPSAADSAVDVGAAADTSAAGYVEMARDTSTGAEQADTVAEGDVALQAKLDTTQAEAEVATDSAVTEVAVAGDTTDNAGRIRPPEDSTETLGQVNTNPAPAAGTPDTAEADRIRPAEDSTETVANVEARTDEVGAAAIGGDVTGAAAVSLMIRQGAQCIVVDPESNEGVRWDMSSTPATLNPCGMGSMNLSKIGTQKGE